MYKDFDNWNEKKKAIEGRFSNIIFRERDIWWCSVGINVGNESCGKGKDFQRPVIILKKLNQNSFIGLCLMQIDCNVESIIYREMIILK